MPAPVPANPFGSHKFTYAGGTRPSLWTQAVLDDHVRGHYDRWKSARIVDFPGVTGGLCNKFSSPATSLTRSEAMGYAMLIVVAMAGYDPAAQDMFDRLLAVVRARPAYQIVADGFAVGKYLMDWNIGPAGQPGDGYNAMDGDMDIAMALCMAHHQWGSAGNWNYLQEARNTINAMKVYNMWDNGTTKGHRLEHFSRTSDWMPDQFWAYWLATGDSLWVRAVDRAAYLADYMQTTYSAGVGFLPEFTVKTNTTPEMPKAADPWGWPEGPNDENFSYNACRCPWRLGLGYLMLGDTRFKTITQRFATKYQNDVIAAGDGGGFAWGIETGYNMAGTVLVGGDSAAFHGPALVAGCIDSANQTLVNEVWKFCRGTSVAAYYDGDIQLLCEIVATGNWFIPLPNAQMSRLSRTTVAHVAGGRGVLSRKMIGSKRV